MDVLPVIQSGYMISLNVVDMSDIEFHGQNTHDGPSVSSKQVNFSYALFRIICPPAGYTSMFPGECIVIRAKLSSVDKTNSATAAGVDKILPTPAPTPAKTVGSD